MHVAVCLTSDVVLLSEWMVHLVTTMMILVLSFKLLFACGLINILRVVWFWYPPSPIENVFYIPLHVKVWKKDYTISSIFNLSLFRCTQAEWTIFWNSKQRIFAFVVSCFTWSFQLLPTYISTKIFKTVAHFLLWNEPRSKLWFIFLKPTSDKKLAFRCLKNLFRNFSDIVVKIWEYCTIVENFCQFVVVFLL